MIWCCRFFREEALKFFICWVVLVTLACSNSWAAVPGCSGIPSLNFSTNKPGEELVVSVSGIESSATPLLLFGTEPDYHPLGDRYSLDEDNQAFIGVKPFGGQYMILPLDQNREFRLELESDLIGTTSYLQLIGVGSPCAPRKLSFSETYTFHVPRPEVDQAKIHVANRGAAKNQAVIPFGMFLKKGHFQSVNQVKVQIEQRGFQTVAAQIDPLAHWSDGSLRHVMVTLRTDMAASEKLTFHLVPGSSQPPSSSYQDLLPQLDVEVEMLNSSNTSYKLNSSSARCSSVADGPLRKKQICAGTLKRSSGAELDKVDQILEIETFSDKRWSRVCYSTENTRSRLSLSDQATQFGNVGFSSYTVRAKNMAGSDFTIENHGGNTLYDMTAHLRCQAVGPDASQFNDLVFMYNDLYLVNAGLHSAPLNDGAQLPISFINDMDEDIEEEFNIRGLVDNNMPGTGRRRDIIDGDTTFWNLVARRSWDYHDDPSKWDAIAKANNLLEVGLQNLANFPTLVRDGRSGYRAIPSALSPGEPCLAYSEWGESNSLWTYNKGSRPASGSNREPDAQHYPMTSVMPYVFNGAKVYLDFFTMATAWGPQNQWPETSIVMRKTTRDSARVYGMHTKAALIVPENDPAHALIHEFMAAQAPHWAERTLNSPNPHPLHLADNTEGNQDSAQYTSSGRTPEGASCIELPNGEQISFDRNANPVRCNSSQTSHRSSAWTSAWDTSWLAGWMKRAGAVFEDQPLADIGDWLLHYHMGAMVAPRDPRQDCVSPQGYRTPAIETLAVKYTSHLWVAEAENSCGTDAIKHTHVEHQTYGCASLYTYSAMTDSEYEEQGGVCLAQPDFDHSGQEDWFGYALLTDTALAASNGTEPQLRSKALWAHHRIVNEILPDRNADTDFDHPSIYRMPCFFCD